MRRFRLIEHTADIGIVAYGKSLAEAYGNVAYGMFSIIAEMKNVQEVESREVEVTEADPEALLFEWLNRLLYIFDVEKLLFKRFDVTELDNKRLKAVCWGEKYAPSRHQIKLGVKSATYHMLKVDAEKKQVRVIFDV